MNTKLLVNGKLVKGKGDELGVLDPATGKVIAQVAEASEEQITAAVKAAAKAFRGLGGDGAEGSRRAAHEARRSHRSRGAWSSRASNRRTAASR